MSIRLCGLVVFAGVLLGEGAWAQAPQPQPAPPPAPRSATSRPSVPMVQARPQMEQIALDLRVTGVPPADAEVYTALRRTLPEFVVRDVPIGEALREWQKRLGVNVHVQVRLLRDAGVALDQPVTVVLKNVTAERVLRLLTQEAGDGRVMNYDVADGVLVISSRDALARGLVTRTYGTGDFTGNPSTEVENAEGGAVRQRAQDIIDLITATVLSDTWMVNGGTGSIQDFRGTLVVSNMPEAHERVVALLHALRSVSRGGSVWVTCDRDADPDADAGAWMTLRRVLPSVSYDNVPLRRVVDDLRERLGVNLHLLQSNLRTAGLDLDTPVRLHLERVSGARVLQQILSDLQWASNVGFDVDGGVVIIATSDHFAYDFTTRIYNIGDLVPGTGPAAFATRERLLDVIMGTVACDTWTEYGGTGQARGIGDMLVVVQPRRVQRQVEDLLRQLRQQGLPASMPARP